MTLYAEVVLPLPLSESFSYLIPENWQEQVKIGTRVLVPFRSRVLTGFVTSLRKRRIQKDIKLKEIQEVLDEKPLFSANFLSFTSKLSDYYFTSWGELLQASLPPAYVLKSKTVIHLSAEGEEALKKEKLSKEEKAILTLLQKKAYTPSFLQRKFGRKSASYFLSRMARREYIHFQRDLKKPERRKLRPVSAPQKQLEIDFGLNGKLRKIVEGITQKGSQKAFSPFLLFGPENERKAIYFNLIKQALEREEKVLFLVPEISLTEHLIEKFEKRLGKEAAVLHSQMSRRKREIEWLRVRSGEAKVVVGPRSALFSPLDNLGLIVVEEEHDDSYYQQESPSYDARKGAWLRAKEEKALLIYGSAMPTVEAFYLAKRGGYLLDLDQEERKGKVTIVEERSGREIMSQQFREKIRDKLKERGQVLIFINRRGYAPLLICSNCRYIPKCANCDITLTYHKKEEKLVCHYCNYSLLKPEFCPECKSRIIRLMGFGIEAVDEELKKHFPQAKVSSFASDEIKGKKQQERVVRSFSKRKIDILAGTQLLAHRTDLPSVSLVGILYPETILSLADYRASQKNFQTISLMMSHLQNDGYGEVIIQSELPSHFSIQGAASQDYGSFFNQEIKLRHLMNYPPFSHMIGVLFQGENLRIVAQKSREFAALVKSEAKEIEVLGPSLAGIRRLRGVSRVQMILKAKKRKHLDEVIRNTLKKVRLRRSISVFR
jgi:primosomal protein N' (replication factor Y)